MTLDDLLDHCERQGTIVSRVKTINKALERIRLLMVFTTFRHIDRVEYKPIDGMYMVVKPVVEEVKIHDGPVLNDALFCRL